MSILLEEISVSFSGGPPVLDGLSLRIEKGDRIAVVAPSGFGKTTLLSVIGLLRRPQSGRVTLWSVDAWRRSVDRAVLRASHIAWVFQTVNLIPHRPVLDNVALAAIIGGSDRATAEARANESLGKVGLQGFGPRAAKSLSGGEAQRVAAARGLCGPAHVLLADEPTANLDHTNRDAVAGALFSLPRDIAVVVATHDPVVAEYADKVLVLDHGRLQGQP